MDNKKYRCCLCGKESYGDGNSPEPIEKNGCCCNRCNTRYVIPTRLMLKKARAYFEKNEQQNAKAFYLRLKAKYGE